MCVRTHTWYIETKRTFTFTQLQFLVSLIERGINKYVYIDFSFGLSVLFCAMCASLRVCMCNIHIPYHKSFRIVSHRIVLHNIWIYVESIGGQTNGRTNTSTSTYTPGIPEQWVCVCVYFKNHIDRYSVFSYTRCRSILLCFLEQHR